MVPRAAEQAHGPEISPFIAPEMQDAQAALKAGDWNGALPYLAALYPERLPANGLWADKAIAATRAAGETPTENVYLFKLRRRPIERPREF